MTEFLIILATTIVLGFSNWLIFKYRNEKAFMDHIKKYADEPIDRNMIKVGYYGIKITFLAFFIFLIIILIFTLTDLRA